ncbi:DUF5060 domain-containing protein [Reichenbachiella sp. MALMAid0571]|uniref:DUF5060 domain-containing protein n=1 Tax=Reichenbachiella sp. MALMAid0571 TaxID=3143939 RepID=UPI0032DE4938
MNLKKFSPETLCKHKFLTFFFFFILTIKIYAGQIVTDKNKEVGIYELFELSILNDRQYGDAYKDVELVVHLRNPDGQILLHYGFFDGNGIWKVRFSPDQKGDWTYKAFFSDSSKETKGEFRCVSSQLPGLILKNENNPFWLGKGGSAKTLFRSFHVGDRFFANNWDDPNEESDGNSRMKFLDWLQKNKYNMLSIASHYTNRNETGRGAGWDTPVLWPLNFDEFRKMEAILNELKNRDITVFPFAGFFGCSGSWPVNPKDQVLYIKYTLARIGHYPNIILSVAGPEPFWLDDQKYYKGKMRLDDILQLGNLIDSLDVHSHILTVHNEKRATQYGDPFIDEPWYSLSTLQGPTVKNREELYTGLSMNHHRYKPVYAQETLWAGNKYHPIYTDDDLRKHTYTILFSGSILNFADMDGNSSSGFSGTLDLNNRFQNKHDIVHKVWDWFESINFHQMTSRQDLVKQGFCLANEGQEYYIYLDSIGKVELFLDFPYLLDSEWINAQNPDDKRVGPKVNKKHIFSTPDDGDDWILHVYNRL